MIGGLGIWGLVFLWTIVCSLILISYSMRTAPERMKIRSNSGFIGSLSFKEARRGALNSGIFIILSNIPYVGFIFMFMLASSSVRISNGISKFQNRSSKAPERFSTVAVITGLGMLLSQFVNLFIPGNTHIHVTSGQYINFNLLTEYVRLLWYPVFLTLEMGTLLSFSSKKVGIFASSIGALFLVIYMGIDLIPSYTFSEVFLYSSVTEILLALTFLANSYSTGRMIIKSGDSMNSNEKNQGYKPQFQKNVRDGKVEESVRQRNEPLNTGSGDYTLSKEEQRNTIAIIGPPGAGKTTFLAYFFHFLRDIERTLNVEADVTSGIELMDEYISRIFTDYKFPQLTAKDRVGEVIFKFTRKKRFGQKDVILRINDIAGETFSSLQGGNDQVRRLIYGTRFEYLLRARAYIVMIDCSTFLEWSTKDLQYRRMLETILGARLDRKIRPKVLFLFTKTDTLPEEAFALPALELLKLLRNTYVYVTKNVSDPNAFKLYIKTERKSSGEIIPKLDAGVGGMKEIRFDPESNSGFMYTANWICEVGDI